MKKVIYVLLYMCMSSLLFACDSDDDSSKPPLEQLPAATQEGKNTMGALINGVPFIPDRRALNPPRGFYQFNPESEKFVLGITAGQGGGNKLTTLVINGLDIEIEEANKTYSLVNEESGNFSGIYWNKVKLVSQSEDSGTLTITKFDLKAQIIAGTFEFTVVNNEGETINITDGRFDIRFTQ